MHCVLLTTIAACLAGQAENKTADAWRAVYTRAADAYEPTIVTNDVRTPVPRLKEPVLEWVSLEDYGGAVYLWTRKQRPELAAAVFSFPQPGKPGFRRVVHEFASFASEEFVVTGPEERTWKPKPASLARVPEAEPPVDNPRLRRLQCRRLARNFSARMIRKDQKWELRMLAKPLVEYDDVAEGILGGGLFAFVGYVTDPEILLLIEARTTPDGPKWHYQPVRFSDKSLFLNYSELPVWESVRTGHGSAGPDTDDPLYKVLGSELLSAESVAGNAPAGSSE